MAADLRASLLGTARVLTVIGCTALVLFSALAMLGPAGPWPQASMAVAFIVLLLLPVCFGAVAPSPAGEANGSSKRAGKRTGVGSQEYTDLLAELEKHRRLERELVAAKQSSEAAMMAKGEFLATMSHEIRTPLNGIIPLLDILLGSRLEPDQREYVGTAYQSARQLLRIVDDILDYSKLEANKLQLETVGINLREMLEGVLRLMEKPAEAKGLKLALRIDPAVRLAVRGDPVRLRQVLTNLLSNAVKFTERGSVSLQVGRRGETRTQHILRFEVRDSGIGIEPLSAAKLFQPFSQAESSTTRTYGGTGLGLVICRRIIDLMEGRIGVESTPGQGSLFWFEVPLLKAVGDIGGRRHDLNGSRALLLTSDERLHRRLAIALPNWGVTFVHAGSTQEALAKLRAAAGRSESWAFHLLLVDLASARTTALALYRNLQRESALEGLSSVYLQGDDPAPAEIVDSERTLVVSREAPEAELRQRVQRFLEGPGTAVAAAPLVNVAAAAPAGGASGSPTGGKLEGQVLLVEDNPVNRQVAQRLLALLGLQVDLAENGREALERLEARHYAAVLMDCQMPVMDGYTATRRQREREGAGAGNRHVPIIAMTANAMVGDREKCLEAGMDDYLSKPLNRALLEETLRRWLAAADIPQPQPQPAAPPGAAGAAATPRAAPASRTPPSPLPPTAAAARPGGPGSGAPRLATAGGARLPQRPPATPAPAVPRAAQAAVPPPGATAAAAASLPPGISPIGGPLQMEVIDDLREIMGAEFDSLVRVFLEDAPGAVARLRRAAEAGEIEALVPPAHSLKSTSANLGAVRLSELAKAIEHGARRQDIADPAGLTRALSDEFDRAGAALRALLR